MCSSTTSINYPAQPSYGESMAEALKAQAEFLKGTGDFAQTGSLESLLPLEESIRKKTAQTDTDILRQTLLGTETKTKVVRDPKTGKFGIPDGEIVSSSTGPAPGQYQMVMADGGGLRILDTSTGGILSEGEMYVQLGLLEPAGDVAVNHFMDRSDTYIRPGYKLTAKGAAAGLQLEDPARVNVLQEHPKRFSTVGTVGVEPIAKHGTAEARPAGFRLGQPISRAEVAQVFQSVNTATPTEVEQIFNFTDPNTGKPIEDGRPITTREGDGMVDLLGDTRFVQEFETRTATAGDVAQGLAEEVGDQFVAPSADTRRAGFDDKGNFLGLSVLAEDIQRGNLSRQREADLQDVSRLSGLYSDIMEDYKPGTASAMQGAKDLIEEQKDNLLADVGISDPAQVQSQGVQADPLRQGLMTQAEEALGQGLTDREERQIAEAARARSTLMGRTFDQSGAIAEAEARVAEDNQRKMQNRAFAQSVLGQEAGIQTADDTRRIGADQFNVGSKMDAERLRESLRQQGLLGYLDAASRISQIENQDALDPFQAILGRGGGTALQQGQSVFGQAGYGLQSQPQYLNPEAGLGYISSMAANQANMYGAQQAAAANRQAGIFGGLGALGGGIATGVGAAFCWVAREVYGAHNPAWLLFREWMLNESPGWFRAIYIKFGERFAKFISNKPRLKARIRLWMDSKIGGK